LKLELGAEHRMIVPACAASPLPSLVSQNCRPDGDATRSHAGAAARAGAEALRLATVPAHSPMLKVRRLAAAAKSGRDAGHAPG